MIMMLRWALRMWSFGRPARVGDPLETRFRVLPVDLDILMHMTNGRYLSVLDAARISYYARTGLWRQFRERGWSPVVTAQSITYRRSLTFPRAYRVRTRLIGTDAKNLYFEQVFHIRDIDHATAVVSVRLTDRGGTSVPPARILALDGTFVLPGSIPAAVAEWSEFSRHHHAEKEGQ
ncbi:thioesterase family protein [Rhodococcus sp. BP-349]|nr:thioesterase family protein [Rhodococcus sp. BP-363]MBY6542384.1 thioesterase family protein [Rhodococcus sp. BP-369]MBY6561614.1 thioesterase family protein [Rhodococcus sp. BP-370]MBY6575906.1 thioesterase family protein [Rhodococcus sp. BP-364]MBY6585207.1 thioesterase family protein [Rhodococcus sp. BP-358]MBY6589544.1 thioesterase family protein [Rhodococcus sp. BP-362]MBY6593923.1 thioesterase family protein [Rhodococcus sp. BP-359]MBY6598220.1 thioesterase family protein [Rhodococc